MLSTSSQGAPLPEEGLKRGSACAVHKVSDAEGAPKAGGGQLCWRYLCKPQRNRRRKQCLKDPAGSFSWQKDVQNAEGHRQKASFVPDKNLAATQALLCQCCTVVEATQAILCSHLIRMRVSHAAPLQTLLARAALEGRAGLVPPRRMFLLQSGPKYQVCSPGPPAGALVSCRLSQMFRSWGKRDKEETKPVKLSYSYVLFLHRKNAVLQRESLQHCRVASWMLEGQPAQSVFRSSHYAR